MAGEEIRPVGTAMYDSNGNLNPLYNRGVPIHKVTPPPPPKPEPDILYVLAVLTLAAVLSYLVLFPFVLLILL